MNKPLAWLLMLPLAACASPAREEAVALVKQGIQHIRSAGPHRAYADFGDTRFQRQGLHLVVYSLDGECLAHGANPSQVGRNLLGQTDIEGRLFMQERLLMVQVMPQGFWHEHKQADLVSKRVEARLMYCERLDNTAVCSGVRR